MKQNPARGEIWRASLDPIKGHEQGGTRPVLVISSDIYNSGPAGLIVVLPLTSKDRRIPMHLPITPPDGGLTSKSFILCDAIRSISKDRLLKRLGAVSPNTMAAVSDRIYMLLDI